MERDRLKSFGLSAKPEKNNGIIWMGWVGQNLEEKNSYRKNKEILSGEHFYGEFYSKNMHRSQNRRGPARGTQREGGVTWRGRVNLPIKTLKSLTKV